MLPNYSDVVRLYDFFMAQPPLMPVYLAAAIVLYKKVMPICQSHRSLKAATVTIKRMGSADLVVKLGCNALHLKNKENIYGLILEAPHSPVWYFYPIFFKKFILLSLPFFLFFLFPLYFLSNFSSLLSSFLFQISDQVYDRTFNYEVMLSFTTFAARIILLCLDFLGQTKFHFL